MPETFTEARNRRRAFDAWPWRMAWRDSRRSRGRLLLFSTALTLGVAALVSIGSLAWNMSRAIDEQARTLVGADLVLESRQPPTPESNAFLQSIPGDQAREVTLPSMALFLKAGGTRLVQVRALDGNFPFYGELVTEPPAAAKQFAEGRGALIEESLQYQFEARAGDQISIGGRAFPILGALRKLPGEAAAFSAFAPRVLIPRDQLPAGLLGLGSLARYKTYYRLPATTDATKFVEQRAAELSRFGLESDTVAHRKRALGRVFENVTHFLNLIGFVSLLLGGLGVASGMHAHLQEKLATVAILRCLGASSRQTVTIYLIQALAMGAVGSFAGAVIGLSIQAIAPHFLADALPVSIHFRVSWSAVGEGVVVGMAACILFTLLPLLPLRRVSPLLALRSAFDAARPGKDPWTLAAYGLLGAGLLLFPWLQSRDVRFSLGFGAALLVAFGLLAGVAKCLMLGARRLLPRSWPYVWRQGLANLYRPNNRTLLLMFTLGLTTFLLLSVEQTKNLLLRQFTVQEAPASQPNLVFFDIQSDQTDAVADLVRSRGLPVLSITPVVMMRITAVKGVTVEELTRRPANGRPGAPMWRLRHEYRSTYRDHLTDTEKIVAGRWQGRVEPGAAKVPISLDRDVARDLRVKVGDEITFDVQGMPIDTVVGSLRRVEWARFQTNFYVVFPVGVLEDAPAFRLLATRAETGAASGAIQSEVVRKFPNVSAIDLSLVVQTVRGIVDKATLAVRVLSLFTIGTGLLVLGAAIWTGRYERARESVLLRTLGASRRQVLTILFVEYLFLGVLAAATGILLATGASAMLAVTIFKIPWFLTVWPIVVSLGAVTGLTVIVGLAASRGVSNRPPLEILRAEE